MPWPDIALDTGMVCTKDFAKALAALILAIDERRELLGYDAILWPYNEAGATKAAPVSTDFVGLHINGTAITNVLAEIRLQIQDLYNGNPDVEWYTDDTFADLIAGIITPPDDAVGTASTWKADHDSLNLLVYATVPGWITASGAATHPRSVGSTMFYKNGNSIYSSIDNGENWSLINSDWRTGLSPAPSSTIPNSNLLSNGLNLLMVSLNYIYTSLDGISWAYASTLIPSPLFNIWSLTGGYYFVALDVTTGNYSTSTNGNSWTIQGNAPWYTSAYISQTMFIDQTGWYVFGTKSGGLTDAWVSYDKSTWTKIVDSATFPAFVSANYFNGQHYIITSSETYTSDDLTTWNLMPFTGQLTSSGNLVHSDKLYIYSPGVRLQRLDSVNFDLTPYLTDQQP